MNKRKHSFVLESGGEDSDNDSIVTGPSEDGSPMKKVSKQTHSAIEKKRREKMNTYIQELSGMIPTCNAMKSKLDKLTILRMAVQHMKTIRGCPSSYKEANYKPSFLSDDELKSLILESAEGFLVVVSCDRGRMLYVSESVVNTLCVSREYLIGQSLFDILHPKDMSKVKEQLSSSDLTPRERFIDTKTGLPVKSDVAPIIPQLSSGSRRSFFCRMRQHSKDSIVKTEDQSNIKKKLKYVPDRKKYVTIQCTGYLKSWPLSQIGVEYDNEREGDTEGCTLSCLIAIAKTTQDVHEMGHPPGGGQEACYQFVSRQAMDGKFTFVDQRATSILGYLPQELLGTSCYEYIHVGDIKQMAENHYAVLLKKEKVETKVYRFRAKNGSFLKFKSKLFCFRNPWTKEVEYIVSTNTLILDPDESNGTSNKSDKTNDGRTVVENILGDIGVQSVLQDVLGVPCNLHPAGVQIGWKIAEEVLERQWNASPSNSPGGTIDENTTGPAESTNIPSPSNGSQSQERSSTSAEAINRSEHLPKEVAGSSQDGSGQRKVAHHDKPPEKEGADGWEDESAMAFIMNLLEADAGLGGAVDFSGLPWPLLNG
ncbi:protein cycle-like [Apostichopus japonicus]|uniref:protein cycle-like n=1 Tax=Stichopus japonicus TaxID=307972 RepID=UPI003AB59D1C